MSFREVVQTPIGPLEIKATDKFITEVTKPKTRLRVDGKGNGLTAQCAKEISEYFSGKRQHFSVKINPTGTPFQRAVWTTLKEIPYGRTLTYRDVAKKIKNDRASRAVGSACGRNPLLILVPCHRVVAQANLGGFGLGLKSKKSLLALEAKP